MNQPDNKQSWFKWGVGVLIAIIGAGGGLVAILNHFEAQKKEANERYQRALDKWENFSPRSISHGVQTVELRGLDRFDLETGRFTSSPNSNLNWDLLFVCAPQRREAMRASNSTEWYEMGVVDFSSIKYRELRDATFKSTRNPTTGYTDLYYDHKSNVPKKGYTFAIKTSQDNVSLIQILRYKSVDPNPDVCRNILLQYEVFPIVNDPPKPTRN